jgi:hypothetical protein
MTQHQSHTYEELEQVADTFDPKELLTTSFVLNGADTSSQASGRVLQELATLAHGAEAFKVQLTTVYDDVENSAFVAFTGLAGHVGDLVAFMASTKAAAGAR